MTATTAKMGLRYPTGTDAPCDGGQQIMDLRDDIYADLDLFTQFTARQKDLPTACVSFQGTQSWPSGVKLRFDTIEQDDVRAADLNTNAAILTLGQPGFEGVYLTGFMVRVDAVNAVTLSQPLSGVVAPLDPRDVDHSSFWLRPNQTVNPIRCASGLTQVVTATQMGLVQNESTRTVTFARMWAVRVGSV